MKTALIFGLTMLAVLLISGCTTTTSVQDILDNPDNYLGEKVTVTGEAANVIKIGGLSGFTLKEGGAAIPVASGNLPEEGRTVTVTGTLMKELLIYYIKADSVL